MDYQKATDNINEKKERDFRNITLTILAVFIILAAVSGGTFAYLTFSTTNNNVISGTSAVADLTLTISKVSPATSGPLIPQLEAGIQTAATSGCVDGNGNNVCQVYSITVQNSSNVTVSVGGSLSFDIPAGSAYANLKWKTISADPTSNTSAVLGDTTSATTTVTQNSIGTASLAASASQTFYVVVWINETNSAQNSTDYGTFTGVVTFTDSTGKGLTSTFAS